jgi:CHAT domain-containing protein
MFSYRFARCLTLALSFLVVLSCGFECGQATEESPPTENDRRPPLQRSPPALPIIDHLEPDKPRQGTIQVGETHIYLLPLAADQFLQLEVEQFDSDVKLQLIGPTGPVSPVIDSSADATKIEPLFLVTSIAGEYRLLIQADKPGCYEVRLAVPKEPTPEDRRRSMAHRAFYEARRYSEKFPQQAADLFRQAIESWNSLSDVPQEARALYELSEFLKGNPTLRVERIEAYERAQGLFERLGDLHQEAYCLQRLGGLYSESGELMKARGVYAQSLSNWRLLDNPRQASFLAFDQANIERQIGRPEAARELLLEALTLVRRSRNLLHEARIRTLLGALYHYRGEISEGIREHRAALQILEQHPRAPEKDVKKQRISTLTSLGPKLGFGEGTTGQEEALQLLHEAHALSLALGDRPRLATVANNLGFIYERMNRPQAALRAYKEALEIYRDFDQKAKEAVVFGNRCRVFEGDDRFDLAWTCYTEALPMVRQVGYQKSEAQILFGLAKIALHKGQLFKARQWIDRALAVVELIRNEAASDDLRSASMGRSYDYYQLAIEVSLALHHQDPKAGHAKRAFLYLESSRARSLLEALVRLRPEFRLPPRLHTLQSEVHRLKVDRLKQTKGDEGKIEQLELKITELLSRLYLERPRYYSFIAPRIVSATEVQELLDSETLLLAYHLGERQSAVWAITQDDIVLRLLPPRTEIEGVARQLHAAMASGGHRIRSANVEHLGRELSRLILSPITDLLDRPRLAIIPAGALRYVPFAALPHPSKVAGLETAPPLLLSHRITTTPSASVVAALRTQHANRPPPPKMLALLAAPVLRADDPRLTTSAATAGTFARRPRPIDLTTPLPYAAAEAEAILQLVAGEDVLYTTGLEANRDFVMNPELGDYRILHFATHGHLDDTHGELSGLVLAQYDANGKAVDGFLWAYELYQLNLAAELVVLSACETALGEEIRGEGLRGLTRGFLYAGAERVLVSLWKVEDQATARLMEHFYRGLIHRSLHPAEALRQAQVELRGEGWRAPYYWAPFILEGDWSGEPILLPRAAAARKKIILP